MLIDDADVKINEGKSRYSEEGSRPDHGGDVLKKVGFFRRCSYMLEEVASYALQFTFDSRVYIFSWYTSHQNTQVRFYLNSSAV